MKLNTKKFTLGLLTALFAINMVIAENGSIEKGYKELKITNNTKYAFNIKVQDKETDARSGMGVHVISKQTPAVIYTRNEKDLIAYQGSHFWIKLDIAPDSPLEEAFNWHGPRTYRYTFALPDKSITIEALFDRRDDLNQAGITFTDVSQ